MDNLKSVDELFNRAGGSVHVAAFLGLNQWTVMRWANTGVPYRHWKALTKKYGASYEDFHKINEKLTLDKKRKAA